MKFSCLRRIVSFWLGVSMILSQPLASYANTNMNPGHSLFDTLWIRSQQSARFKVPQIDFSTLARQLAQHGHQLGLLALSLTTIAGLTATVGAKSADAFISVNYSGSGGNNRVSEFHQGEINFGRQNREFFNTEESGVLRQKDAVRGNFDRFIERFKAAYPDTPAEGKLLIGTYNQGDSGYTIRMFINQAEKSEFEEAFAAGLITENWNDSTLIMTVQRIHVDLINQKFHTNVSLSQEAEAWSQAIHTGAMQEIKWSTSKFKQSAKRDIWLVIATAAVASIAVLVFDGWAKKEIKKRTSKGEDIFWTKRDADFYSFAAISAITYIAALVGTTISGGASAYLMILEYWKLVTIVEAMLIAVRPVQKYGVNRYLLDQLKGEKTRAAKQAKENFFKELQEQKITPSQDDLNRLDESFLDKTIIEYHDSNYRDKWQTVDRLTIWMAMIIVGSIGVPFAALSGAVNGFLGFAPASLFFLKELPIIKNLTRMIQIHIRGEFNKGDVIRVPGHGFIYVAAMEFGILRGIGSSGSTKVLPYGEIGQGVENYTVESSRIEFSIELAPKKEDGSNVKRKEVYEVIEGAVKSMFYDDLWFKDFPDRNFKQMNYKHQNNIIKKQNWRKTENGFSYGCWIKVLGLISQYDAGDELKARMSDALQDAGFMGSKWMLRINTPDDESLSEKEAAELENVLMIKATKEAG